MSILAKAQLVIADIYLLDHSLTVIFFFQSVFKMASLLKTKEANAAKRKEKRKADDTDVDLSQGPKPKRNKQRVLLLSSRGVTHRMRHLMNDLEVLLPHVKKGIIHPKWSMTRVIFVDEGSQTRNWTRRINSDFCQNWLTSTIATTPCISRHAGTKIYICG